MFKKYIRQKKVRENRLILELRSPVRHNAIQTVTLVSRDILIRVVPPLMKVR